MRMGFVTRTTNRMVPATGREMLWTNGAPVERIKARPDPEVNESASASHL
ncbi:rCG56900, partial [Rattus norvegicus]